MTQHIFSFAQCQAHNKETQVLGEKNLCVINGPQVELLCYTSQGLVSSLYFCLFTLSPCSRMVISFYSISTVLNMNGLHISCLVVTTI